MAPLHEKLFDTLKELGVDPELIGKFLVEQVNHGQEINDLMKEANGNKVYYDRKNVLSQVELLSIILTKKHTYGNSSVAKKSR